MLGPRARRIGAWLPFALVIVAGAAHAASYWLPFEDAYITYRYAENLAHGNGLAYNVGERVEGFTSFLWTILLSAATTLHLPIVETSHIASVVAGLSMLAIVAPLMRAMLPNAPTWTAAVAAALVAADGSFAYYAASGMETTAFALVVAIALLLASRGGSLRANIAAGVVLAASAMLRPEGAGYAALAVAALAVHAGDRRDALRVGASFAAVFLPYFAARWAYFGWPLPNTYYAKASPSGALFGAGLSAAEGYLTSNGFWLAIGAAIYLALRAGGSRAARLTAALVLGSVVNVVIVGGDTFAFHRFFVPALVPGAIAVAAVAQRLAPSRKRPAFTLAVGALVVLVVVWKLVASVVPTRTLLVRQVQSERERVLGVAKIDADYFTVGRWLAAHAPSDTLLATNAAGIVPYESGLRAIDMLGLTDAHVAHARIRLGYGVRGHEKHDATYILSRAPDVILLGLPVLAPRPVRPNELEPWVSRWFPFLPGDRELWTNAEFRAAYAPVGVPVGDRFLVMFVRRGGKLDLSVSAGAPPI
jgi:hypothetical protein